MVAGLIRDSAFGHIVRFVTRNKYFQFEEERDPSIAIRYYNTEKTRNIAKYGKTSVPEEEQKNEKRKPSDSAKRSGADAQLDQSQQLPPPAHHPSTGSIGSEETTVDMNRQVSNVTGTPVDPERGRDLTVVDWDGPNDPENPLNWSMGKKFFVTFEICLLTFGVYIGSAIYTAGLQDIEKTFGVSEVAGVLGLTLFVLGYGLGMFTAIFLVRRSTSLRLFRANMNFHRSNDLVSIVRNPTDRPHSHLHSHTARLRRLPSPNSSGQQLRYAARFSILDRVFRLARFGDWWCHTLRHLRTQKARLCHLHLGHGSRLWTYYGTSGRWVRRYRQGLDMADLGAHVAVWFRSCYAILLLA